MSGSMKNRPVVTITFILMTLLTTFLSPVFDSSVYGINGHPAEWLSFLPTTPFRHYGLGLFFSPFIHLDAAHLFMNLIFFVPVAMMIERKEEKSLTYIFFIVHFFALSMLFVAAQISPMNQKAFLGMSHIIMGLYFFEALKTKSKGLLFFALCLSGLSFWFTGDAYRNLSHFSGAAAGIILFGLYHFWNKLRLKTSH